MVLGRDESSTVLEFDGSREGDRAFSSLCESSPVWADRRCLFEGRPSMMGAQGEGEEPKELEEWLRLIDKLMTPSAKRRDPLVYCTPAILQEVQVHPNDVQC